eukprot:11335688-Alexandrium_andersonii.AAC.1
MDETKLHPGISLRAELISTNNQEVLAIYIRGVGPEKARDWFHWEDQFPDPLLSVVASCANLPGLS